MQCPECSTELRPDARACGCGWQAVKTVDRDKVDRWSQPPNRFACSHHGCGFDARMRKDMGNGLVNICEPHYEQWFQNQVEQRAVDKGLLTWQQCREWLKVNPLKQRRV